MEPVRDIVDKTMKEFKERAAVEYSKLDLNPSIEAAVRKAVNDVTEEYIQISKEFGHEFDHSEIGIKKLLGKHLPPERIDSFSKGLTMNITKKSDGKVWDDPVGYGKEFYPPRELEPSGAGVDSGDGGDDGSKRKYAIFLIEAVKLVMSICKIKIYINERVMIRALDETIKTLTCLKSFNTFSEDWKKAGTSKWNKASAIVQLIMAMKSEGIFSEIVKLLTEEMSDLDKMLIVGRLLATIVVAQMTGGVVLIAMTFLFVMDAVEFLKKIENVMTVIDSNTE